MDPIFDPNSQEYNPAAVGIAEVAIEEIVTRCFPNIETLEPRGLDSLDFHDISIVSLKDALWAAFAAGMKV